MKTSVAFNPFPGLRSFNPDEDHLFFGREKEIDELLRRLRITRFLSVIGTSGSGKSSLVRSGLIPSLYSGFMVNAGSSWRVAMMRPGEDPIGNLSSALDEVGIPGTFPLMAGTNRVLLEATLRRSTLGLVEAIRQARVPAYENVLVVVDQFEELFRYQRTRETQDSGDDAIAFVKLLLEAAHNEEFPIHVVLTMRSDFIGDCLKYPGLPEAVNAGQYLVPRMTRDQLRSAITGPVAVGGGSISPRLVLRLLNDIGDDSDQLPVLQHALMRTWNYWERHQADGDALDISHYEAIGTMRQALSMHAEEAWAEIQTLRGREIAEKLFKALTDTSTDSRGVRRPTSVQELAAICEAPEADVISIVEIFRRLGRCFLVPPATVPLDAQSIIDISHESLMRNWTRLIDWAEQERIAAAYYERLAQSSAWYEEGTAGLWRDPELELGLEWKRKNRPTAAWARRYNPSFTRALEFLERSETERNRLRAAQDRDRKRKLRVAWSIAGILAFLLVLVGVAAISWRAERARAENNLQLAKQAVDEMLSSAGSESARIAADVPQMEEFRRELLEKARTFYSLISTQRPDSEVLRQEMAMAHFRLGDIHRLLQETDPAMEQYRKAITEFDSLRADFPDNPVYRQRLADAYNWLGETGRTQEQYRSEAATAYDSALELQQALHRDFADNAEYQQQLARTHYNRGILRSDNGLLDESDFREAIRLLESLAAQDSTDPAPVRQELARAYNNLARLLRRSGSAEESQRFYERAIAIHESLIQREPQNREYKLELASFYNNVAVLLQERNLLEPANQRNQQALGLFEFLAEPIPAVGIETAHAHNLRGRILEDQGFRAEAEREYEQAVVAFERIAGLTGSVDFHLRFGQALFNLSALRRDRGDIRGALNLLSRAVAEHSAARSSPDLAYDYLLLVELHLAEGSIPQARAAATRLSELLPELSGTDRNNLSGALDGLRNRLGGSGAR